MASWPGLTAGSDSPHYAPNRCQADNFTSQSQLRAAVAEHDAAAGAGPLEVSVVPGADHFFSGLWEDVAAGVGGWLAQVLQQAARPRAAEASGVPAGAAG